MLTGYPALADEGDSVRIRVTDDRTTAVGPSASVPSPCSKCGAPITTWSTFRTWTGSPPRQAAGSDGIHPRSRDLAVAVAISFEQEAIDPAGFETRRRSWNATTGYGVTGRRSSGGI